MNGAFGVSGSAGSGRAGAERQTRVWWLIFLLAVALAAALRLPELGLRPMHNDEAVNALKFGALWAHGEYRYDPQEYHGPTLPYLTAALGWLTAAPDFQHYSAARLRLITALAGVALIGLLPLLRDGLGRGAVLGAAAFTALSPALVFYSRYWIHEELLVLFTLLTIAAGWRWWRGRSWRWAALTGLGLGLMQATKETFVFAVVAALGALFLNWLWLLFTGPKPGKFPPPLAHVSLALAVWLLVWLVLFTSFFANAGGLVDSLRTYALWFQQAKGESPHAHPWSFYFARLFWFHPAGGPFWSEGLLLVLGLVGAWDGLRSMPRSGARPELVRFLAGFTVLLAGIYTVIPYKTPWCALGFLHGLVMLAGVGAAALWQLSRRVGPRVAVALLLGAGATHLGWEAWRASFPMCAERTNPWVYAQTSPDLLELVEQVNAVATVAQHQDTVIEVVAKEGDYWPLPWYLRGYEHVGWWAQAPARLVAPVVIASAGLKLPEDVTESHVMAGYFQLRPGVFLELHVERQLWEKYVAR